MFAEKKKISGFGHRVYHTEDPRATHLRRMSEELGRVAGSTKWFDLSRKIELFVKQGSRQWVRLGEYKIARQLLAR